MLQLSKTEYYADPVVKFTPKEVVRYDISLRSIANTFTLQYRWVIGENLTDRNYRLYGSGVDSPGINLEVKARYRF